jgi:hypothetical protein
VVGTVECSSEDAFVEEASEVVEDVSASASVAEPRNVVVVNVASETVAEIELDTVIDVAVAGTPGIVIVADPVAAVKLVRM